MTVALSTSSAPKDVWVIQRDLFAALAKQVIDREATDHALVEQLHLAEVTNGLALDILSAEQPALALRVRDALRRTAVEIAHGHCVLPHADLLRPAAQASLQAKFAELVAVLDRFHS